MSAAQLAAQSCARPGQTLVDGVGPAEAQAQGHLGGAQRLEGGHKDHLALKGTQTEERALQFI